MRGKAHGALDGYVPYNQIEPIVNRDHDRVMMNILDYANTKIEEYFSAKVPYPCNRLHRPHHRDHMVMRKTSKLNRCTHAGQLPQHDPHRSDEGYVALHR